MAKTLISPLLRTVPPQRPWTLKFTNDLAWSQHSQGHLSWICSLTAMRKGTITQILTSLPHAQFIILLLIFLSFTASKAHSTYPQNPCYHSGWPCLFYQLPARALWFLHLSELGETKLWCDSWFISSMSSLQCPGHRRLLHVILISVPSGSQEDKIPHKPTWQSSMTSCYLRFMGTWGCFTNTFH